MSQVDSSLPEAESPPEEPGSKIGPVVVGTVLVVVGLVLLQQTFKIPGEGFDPQGPRFFPLLVASLWMLLSLLYLGRHLLDISRGKQGMASERYEHIVPVVLITVLLVAYAYALDPLGYLIASSVFFVLAAACLGSRNLARDCTVGILLSVVVYVAFTQGLGVRLPEGVLGL